MSLNVGLTYDLKDSYKIKEHLPADIDAEFDAPETIEMIAASIETGGHRVVKIGNVKNLLASLDELKEKIDIVFNICEGLSGRNREAQVPVILEMAGIPFVGADGLTLSLTLDKIMAKKIFIAEGIPTPKYFVVKQIDTLYNLDHLNFPLMVKPAYEGTSKGITCNSRVETIEQLKRRLDYVISTYRQPALVEEFIQGTEFTVAIIGNNPPEAYPPVQVHIDNDVNLGDRFYTFELVYASNLGYIYPAKISDKLKNRLCELALRAYQAVDCRDFGRVDFRVDFKGRPYVLEINPLPSLALEDVFTLIAKHEDIPYSGVINKILNAAVERYNLDSMSRAERRIN